MASFADGIGEAMDGVFKLAGCAIVFGLLGGLFGAGALIWVLLIR